MKFEDMKEGLLVLEGSRRGRVDRIDATDLSVLVAWDNGDREWWFDFDPMRPAANPIKPAEPPAGAAPLGAQPAGDWVSGKEYAALKAELEAKNRSHLHSNAQAEEAITMYEEFRTANNDLRGERDSLKAQVARLERALDDAQRRGRR